MASYLSRLHHISLHVSNVDKVAQELVSRFQFDVFAARLTEQSKQLAVRRGSAVFLVNERPYGPQPRLNGRGSRDLSSVLARDLQNSTCLYEARIRHPVDTACNVCFEVSDVESASRLLRDKGCEFLQPPTEVHDDWGAVTFSVIRSVVGNVCHTLVDASRYRGVFLPGFEPVQTDRQSADSSQCPVTHFDHVTFACPRHFSPSISRWYQKIFGWRRFLIHRSEEIEDGLVLDHDGIGLRLTALEAPEEPDCKFVIAESLHEQGKNQVETFLDQHRGPGIQHVGLYTQDIVRTAETLGRAGVEFFSPPSAYYTDPEKRREIAEAGYDLEALSHHGILLDTDVLTHTQSRSPDHKFLLQVFSRPVFEEDTFFLELIQRCGASGFGEGNIRALWRSVQNYMENQQSSRR